jgi:hypothetical protein
MITNTTNYLEPGTYWVGDLCYVMDHARTGFDWAEFCRWTFENDPSGREREGAVTHQGIDIAFHGTAFGDGCFTDQYGNEYGVDAGMIGCVRETDIDLSEADKRASAPCAGGHLHDFPEPFTTEYDDGAIRIGHVIIETTRLRGRQYRREA